MSTPSPRTVIGIDCATQPRKVGLALATWTGEACVLQEVACLRTWDAITDTATGSVTNILIPSFLTAGN